DNGKRALPTGLPKIITSSNTSDQTGPIGRLFPNNWCPETTTATPYLRMSLGLNRLFDIGSLRMSTVSAISYSNSQTITDDTRNSYESFDPQKGASGELLKFGDKMYT